MAVALFLLLAATTSASVCDRTPAAAANERGLAQMFGGDFAKALVSFDEAPKLDPRLGQARLNRGIAFLLHDQGPDGSSARSLCQDRKRARISAPKGRMKRRSTSSRPQTTG